MAQSATAAAFGASVAIRSGREAKGLYLVVGDDDAPVVVRSSGGQIITTIGSGRHLALLTLEGSSSVKRHHKIRLCGAVNIDRQRFDGFLMAAGVAKPP